MVLTERKKTILAEAALLLCGVAWGSGFVVMKNALDNLPVNWLLAIRFFFAGLILFFALFRQMIRADWRTLLHGAVCGFLMYCGHTTQTVGLQTTTAGNNAFLTVIYVVLVPFFQWMLYKKFPGARALAAGALCLLGVGVIALQAGFTVHTGDLWTLLCGVLFAFHILYVAHCTRRGAPVLPLTAFQFLFSSLFAAISGLFLEPLPTTETLLEGETFFSLSYLVLVCTLFALVAQNLGIRHAPTAHASLLMGTEAPFGSLFGILFLNEPFTARFLIGALLIAGSIVASELKKPNAAAAGPSPPSGKE